MTKSATVKVLEVKQAPTLSDPAMISGIRDRAAAEAWGTKHGYVTVYFLASRQRVYAERMQAVAAQAAALEARSEQLVLFAEGAQ